MKKNYTFFYRVFTRLPFLTKSKYGQSVTGLMISSAIGILILLSVQNILTLMNRNQKNSELMNDFTLLKNQIGAIMRKTDQCTASFYGQSVDPDDTTIGQTCDPAFVDAQINWPAYCSDADIHDPDACAAASQTWTSTVFLESNTTPGNKGYKITSVCFKNILNNGPTSVASEEYHHLKLILKAEKTSSQYVGQKEMELVLYFPAVLDMSSPSTPLIKRCGDR